MTLVTLILKLIFGAALINFNVEQQFKKKSVSVAQLEETCAINHAVRRSSLGCAKLTKELSASFQL